MVSPLPPRLRWKLKVFDGQVLPFSASSVLPVYVAATRLTKRGWRSTLFLAVLCFMAGMVLFRSFSYYLGRPSLYEEYHSREEKLPHYEEYARRSDVKYLWAENFAHNSGWGNVMQDFIMMGLVAHATNRSHVFSDYVWDLDHGPYSNFHGKSIPSRIPLTAIVGGPMVGGELPPGDTTPRAVSRSFFHRVCPNPTIVNVKDVNTDEIVFGDVSASSIFEMWVQKINSIDDQCIQLEGSHNLPIFDYWMYGDKKRMLPVWPYLSKSPVVTHWRWSPLVIDAFKKNLHFLAPTSPLSLFSNTPNVDSSDIIPGLLAIHVRRGDFADHCKNLAAWSSEWNAFNAFPQFIDKFKVPQSVGLEAAAAEDYKTAAYERRCYPSIDQIVEKVSHIRDDADDSLNYLYIMTNGASEWVSELKQALQRATAGSQPWENIASSRDLQLTWEQKYVAQAVDMYVAERAQVLIGNGWSSLTSNVNVLRMGKKFPPESSRFW
ncbi:hypothetical protein CONPUDRAFT_155708 [Coniophora puteana RWD-64-598 SS2]|uniref:Uncharacterized protein n=1 Tax=Coniophora puteana (strain RWD-64-598) TaxID=741705 RepID=A0A5M3MII6_CONPW|nr:uncharacterized protein CONPUDRAFT_155708 [Coniophora puteana RWD-64-598 SS2]EIW79022.1 hypothetical protein CONPUDRAFT_155708 [Coniophora puteana RWD-64-598 SS2]